MEKGPVSETSSGLDVHMEGDDTERRDERADRSRRDKQNMVSTRTVIFGLQSTTSTRRYLISNFDLCA